MIIVCVISGMRIDITHLPLEDLVKLKAKTDKELENVNLQARGEVQKTTGTHPDPLWFQRKNSALRHQSQVLQAELNRRSNKQAENPATKPSDNNMIECIIKRDGPTQVNIEGFQHTFLKNEEGRYVCQIHSPHHREWLLGFPQMYREYVPDPPKLPGVPKNDVAGSPACECVNCAGDHRAEAPEPVMESPVIVEQPLAADEQAEKKSLDSITSVGAASVPSLPPGSTRRKQSIYANEI